MCFVGSLAWACGFHAHKGAVTSVKNPEISLRKNGPRIAKNVAVFVLPNGSHTANKPIYALCRSGKSRNKPYCDRSHNEAGFDSATQNVESRVKVYTYEAEGVA